MLGESMWITDDWIVRTAIRLGALWVIGFVIGQAIGGTVGLVLLVHSLW